MAAGDRLTRAVQDLVAAQELELVDCDFVGTGSGRVLRVIIDNPAGVSIDMITDMSHEISRMLDERDLVPGDRYSLEVSSPGLERTLRTPAHFQRFIASKVKVKTHPHVEGDRRFVATILSANELSVCLHVGEGAKAYDREVPYTDIEKATTIFEWGPAPKPTGAKKVTS